MCEPVISSRSTMGKALCSPSSSLSLFIIHLPNKAIFLLRKNNSQGSATCIWFSSQFFVLIFALSYYSSVLCIRGYLRTGLRGAKPGEKSYSQP